MMLRSLYFRQLALDLSFLCIYCAVEVLVFGF